MLAGTDVLGLPDTMSASSQQEPVRIYLDVCCINRPLDDQAQERVRNESEAVLHVLAGVALGWWQWVTSEMVTVELQRTPDPDRKEFLLAIARRASYSVTIQESQVQRAQALARHGIEYHDGLHVACAEAGGVRVFLTVDDVLMRRLRRIEGQLRVVVRNPCDWLREIGRWK